MSTPRIDNLVPGSIVTLNLRNYQEDVVFLRITGTGEDRHAEFVSSADRLSVVAVKDEGTKPL